MNAKSLPRIEPLEARIAPASFVWDGSVSSDWFTPANWSPDGIPGATDTAVLNNSGLTINLPANAAVAVFQESAGTLTGPGTLDVLTSLDWSGGTMAGTGTTAVAAGATFSISGTAIKTLNQRTLSNAGTATWSGTGDLAFDNGASFVGSGVFVAQSDAVLRSVGSGNSFSVQAGGTFDKNTGSGLTEVQVAFVNAGTVTAQSGILNFTGSFSQSAGLTRFSGGNLATSSTMNFTGGELTGIGTLAGNLSNTGATIRPGNGGTGILTVSGDFVQSSSGRLAMEIGGITPGTLHDQLSVGGTATLGGTLTANFIGGFIPTAGNVFNIVVAGTRSGTFSAVSAAGLLQENYTLTQAQLINNATTYVWDGSAGDSNWFTAANWTPQGVPGAEDAAILSINSTINLLSSTSVGSFAQSSGTFTTPANVTFTVLESFNLSGGTLAGAGTVNTLGDWAWTAGVMNGTGTMSVAGTASTISGTAGKFLDRVLTNSGTITYSGSGFLFGASGVTPGVLNNTGTFNVTGGGDLSQNNGNAAHAINNSGSWHVSGTGFTSSVSGIAFNNSGTLNVNAGTLALLGGSFGMTAGDFSISSGAALRLGGNFGLGATADVAGAGSVDFVSGTINVGGTYNITGASSFSGGTANFNAPVASLGPLGISGGGANFNTPVTTASVNLSGGTLGGSAGLSVLGDLTWTGGTMAGTGTTSVAGAGSTISGPGGKFLDRVLSNSGTITFSTSDATNPLFFGASGVTPGVLNNSGTFNVTAGGDIAQNNFNAGHAINNSGSWNVSGTGFTSSVSGIAFNNSGTLNVNSGTLALLGGSFGTTTGDFSISGGAALRLGGNFGLGATADVAGAGSVDFVSGTINVGGTYNITGASSFSGGTANFNAPVASLGTGPLTISSGAANFNTPVTAVALNFSGGTLGGSATLSVLGDLTWTGGTMAGTGTTSLAGAGSTISGPGGKFLDRVLTNSGTITFSTSDATNPLFFGASGLTPGVLNNSGTFNVTAGGDFAQNNFNAGHAINNSGSWNVSGTTFTSSVSAIAFNNSGTLNVNSGTLALLGGSTGTTTGDFSISGGAALRMGGNFGLGVTADVAGAGSVDFVSGTINVGGTYNITGASSFSGGTANFNTAVASLGTGLLSFSGATVNFNAPVTNFGTGPLTISGGAANFNSNDLTMSAINLTGGTLGGSAAVSTLGDLTWTAGTMSGTGTTSVAGAASTISGPGGKFLDRVLSNSGTITFSTSDATNPLFFGASGVTPGVLNNSGTFNVTAGGDIAQNNFNAGHAINNSGSWNVSGTGFTSSVSGIAFNNSGTLNVNSGTLALLGGSFGTTTGDFSISGGAALRLGGNFGLGATADVAGAGSVDFVSGTINVGGTYNITGASSFSGGTVNFNAPVASLGSGLLSFSGATVNFNAPVTNFGTGPLTISGGAANFNANDLTMSAINLSGGTLGGSATVSTPGDLTWTAGTMGGTGMTSVAGAASTISGPGGKFLDRVLSNSGTITFSTSDATNPLFFGASGVTPGVLNNSGTFNVTAGGDFAQNNFNAGHAINNSGSWNVSGTGFTSSVSGIAFNNSGTLNVNSGTLALLGGSTGTTTGDFSISGGAALRLGGNFGLGATADVAGAGSVDFVSGTINVGGTYNITGASSFSGGTVNFNAPVASLGSGLLSFSGATVNFNAPVTNFGTGPLTISGGAANFNANDLTMSAINLSGGTLGGSATVSTPGDLTWTAGTMGGTGTTSVAGAASTISGPGGKFLDRVLSNSGTLTLSTSDATNPLFFGASGLTPGVLNNSGTLNVTAGGDFAQNNFNAGHAINNSGSWHVSGTGFTSSVSGIAFTNSGTLNAPGTILTFTGGFTQSPGGSILGGNVVNFNGGAVTARGTIVADVSVTNAVVSPGNGVAGELSITGNYIQSGGTLRIELGGMGPGEFDKLSISGTAVLAGTLNLSLLGGFNPSGGQQFAVLTYDAHTGSFGSLTGAAGFTQNYQATGLVLTRNAVSYVWDGGGGGDTSWFNALNWGPDGIPAGSDSATLSSNVIITLPSAASVGIFTQSSGILTGAGTLTVGSFNWNAGTQGGSGTTTVSVGGSFNLSGSGVKILTQRTLDQAGAGVWTGTGMFQIANGATFNNTGSFQIQNDARLEVAAGGAAPRMVNSGTIQKTGGTGTTTFSDVHFENSGSLLITAGTVALTGADASFTQSGGVTTLAGGSLSAVPVLNFNGGSLVGIGTLSASVVNNGATVQPGGGNAAGRLSINGAYTQAGGGTLNIEIGGLAAGTQYDQLTVSGTGTLGGNLAASLINGFAPGASDVFDVVVTAATRTGTFSTVSGASQLTANYTLTQAQLVRAVVGPASFVWDGSVSSDWFTAANWTPDGVPGVIDTAILNINSTINLPSATSVGTFQQSNGTLTSPAGVTFTVLGTFDWTGGTQGGAGTTIVSGALNLNGAAEFLNRALVNDGTTNWTSGDVAGNGSFTNNGIFNESAGRPFSPSFTNATGAMFNHSSGASTFTGGFANAGAVNVSGGLLSLGGGGTSTGSFAVAGDLRFSSGGPFALNGGTIAGGGNVEFAGADVTFGAGTNYSFTGLTVIQSSSVVAFDTGSAVTFPTLSQSSFSTLTGTSDFLVTSSFAWNGGVMSGAGTTTIAPGAMLTLGNDVLNRALINNGTANGTSATVTGTGSFLNNGVFNGATGTSFAPSFVNASGGTLNQLSGANSFTGVVTNAGAVNIDGGTLNLSGSFTQTSGSTTLASGNLAGGITFAFQGGTLSGAGTIAGSVNNTGAVIKPGGNAAGTFAITGNFMQGPSGVLSIELGGTTPGTQHDLLMIGGTATLGGSLNLALINGFIPPGGSQFAVLTAAPRTGTFDTVSGSLAVQYNANDVTLFGPPPVLSINDVSVAEGLSGAVLATFTVSLSAPSTEIVTVQYATTDGSALAPGDYTAQGLTTLTFAPGEVSKTVAVSINGDTDFELNETFFVNLSSPSGATIADAQGQGTIGNDDVVISDNGRTATLTDMDGDQLNVTTDQGRLTEANFVFAADGTLQMIQLADARFEQADLTFTAAPTPGGNGRADVPVLDATGMDLGRVSIDGALGMIMVGDGNPNKPALKKLTVGSLGTDEAVLEPLQSEVRGAVGKLIVLGDVNQASFNVDGRLGSVSIGGDLRGAGGVGVRLIAALARFGGVVALGGVGGGVPEGVFADSIGTFTLNGNLSGAVVAATGRIGSVLVGGDVAGGSMIAAARIPVVKVLRNLASDDPNDPVIVAIRKGLDLLRVNGNVNNAQILLGYQSTRDPDTGDRTPFPRNPDASVGRVKVNGDWSASSLVAGVLDATGDGFGQNDTLITGDRTRDLAARIASIVIKGTATGSAAPGDHFGITAQSIGKLSIDGENIALKENKKDNILLDPINGDFRVVEVKG